ncbi:MFS transporter [Photobacterium minamisatsumaniensis]|uniref:MFS transporter n=1 Tax=Photobacterium minamisatsumaniensis TaxID=2910233 RepID=UPI003D125734
MNIKFVMYLSPALFLGLGAAFFNPLQSTFFIAGKGLSPDIVGIYLACSTGVALITSQIVGALSDKGLNRRSIIQASAVCGMIGFSLMGSLDNIIALMAVGLTFVCLATIGAPQVFAMAKEKYEGDSTFLLAAMRACISLSWVFAPPLAFLVGAIYGYETACFLTSGMYGLVLISSFTLPSYKSSKKKEPQKEYETSSNNSLYVAIPSLALLYMAVNNYIMLMPVYITETLGFESWVPGMLFGVTAGIEIPIILLTAKLTKYISHSAQMIIASVTGLIYFTLFSTAFDSIEYLIAIQLFNAVSIAFSSTSALQIMQQILPTRIGFASTVYSNSIAGGMACGALLGGQVASTMGYEAAMFFNAALCIGSVCFSLILWQKLSPNKKVMAYSK